MKLPSHAVRARRFFYGPTETTLIAFVGTLAECREFLRKDGDEIYRTSHNESGRWRLRIVTTNSLRPYARREAYDSAVTRHAQNHAMVLNGYAAEQGGAS